MLCQLADPSATEALGQALADCVRPGMLVTLDGPLGSGKTHLVRALLRAIGHSGRVRSPTYTVMEPYDLAWGRVCHFDFYRFSKDFEADDAGLREEFNAATLCVVEWPLQAGEWLPSADLALIWQPVTEGRLVQICAAASTCLPVWPAQSANPGGTGAKA